MAEAQLPVHEQSQSASSPLAFALRAASDKPWTVLLGLLAGLVMGIVIAFLLPPVYTARTTFIPPANNTGSTSMLMSQLGALTGVGNSFGAMKDPGAIYVGILSSRTVADEIIAEFNLRHVYKLDKLSQAEKALAGHVKVMENKDNMIEVTVGDHDPKRAADMANAMVHALIQQNNRLAVTEASQRRAFFEQQLIKEKDALADAEVELTKTEEKTGMIHPTWQAQMQIQSIAQTRAQIASREIQLAALEKSETAENPEVVRLHTELDALQSELSRLEGSSGGKEDPVMPPASKTPELAQEYIRKERDVKFHELLFDMLFRQYENAKLDEARNAPMIQVVDEAVVPDSKSGPPRMIVAIAFALLGFLVSVVAIVLRAHARNLLASNPNPEPPLWKGLLCFTAGKAAYTEIAGSPAGRVA